MAEQKDLKPASFLLFLHAAFLFGAETAYISVPLWHKN